MKEPSWLLPTGFESQDKVVALESEVEELRQLLNNPAPKDAPQLEWPAYSNTWDIEDDSSSEAGADTYGDATEEAAAADEILMIGIDNEAPEGDAALMQKVLKQLA